jgi:hypothetical protein
MSFWDFITGKRSARQLEAWSAAPAPPVAFAPPPPAPAAAPAAPAAPAPSIAPTGFTVEKAIELMRALPFDDGSNAELVLRVVRKTLQSTGISVPEIVDAAAVRERALAATLDADRAAIAQLEREIAARQASMAGTERELSETRSVRERLEDAIENETQIGVPIVRDEPSPPSSASLAASAVKPPPLPPAPKPRLAGSSERPAVLNRSSGVPKARKPLPKIQLPSGNTKTASSPPRAEPLSVPKIAPLSAPRIDAASVAKVDSEPKVDAASVAKVASEPKVDAAAVAKVEPEPKVDAASIAKIESEPKVDAAAESQLSEDAPTPTSGVPAAVEITEAKPRPPVASIPDDWGV